MRFSDYFAEFESTSFHWDVENWHKTVFSRFDDTALNNGRFGWCGATCTRHIVTVRSPIAQNVLIQANTWTDRMFSAECIPSNRKPHTLYKSGDSTAY